MVVLFYFDTMQRVNESTYVLDLVFFCMVLTANNLGNLCFMLSDILMLKSVLNLKAQQHNLCTNYKTKTCYYLDISPNVDPWC